MISATAINGVHRAGPAVGSRPFIPECHFRAIHLHLLRVLAEQPGPLMLGIHGPPGVGKTFGVREVLAQLRVRSFPVSSGQLESHEAGRPAQIIRAAYLAASRTIAGQPNRGPQPAALLFNDIDVGLGDWGKDVQYTVNRQTAIGELMHLADFPDRVAGRNCKPVPILLTGNDLGKLYQPLVRAGRMALLQWTLDFDDRLGVLQGIFPELSIDDVIQLATEFPDEPVVFFSEIRRRCQDTALMQATAGLEPARTLRLAMTGALTARLPPALGVNQLVDLGQRLRRESRLIDHLGEGSQ
jgi:ATPase family associated with various cellular activities (AAA)